MPSFVEFLARGVWGSKDKSTNHDALQVLTAIGHVEKEFKGFQDEYYHLCEYAHPNMKGVVGAYADIAIPSYTVTFGTNPVGLPIGPFGLGALDIALEVALDLNERIRNERDQIAELLENHATKVFID